MCNLRALLMIHTRCPVRYLVFQRGFSMGKSLSYLDITNYISTRSAEMPSILGGKRYCRGRTVLKVQT